LYPQEEEAKLSESSSLSGSHGESDSFRTKLQLAAANSPTLDEIDLKYAGYPFRILRLISFAFSSSKGIDMTRPDARDFFFWRIFS
jgi:hypothetical protein